MTRTTIRPPSSIVRHERAALSPETVACSGLKLCLWFRLLLPYDSTDALIYVLDSSDRKRLVMGLTFELSSLLEVAICNHAPIETTNG
jgi:hypothetical protein